MKVALNWTLMGIIAMVIQRKLTKTCNLGELYQLARNLKLWAKKEGRAKADMEVSKALLLDSKMKSINREYLEMNLILIKISALRTQEQLSLHLFFQLKGKIQEYTLQKNLISIKIGTTFRLKPIHTTTNVLSKIIKLWERMDCSLKIFKIWYHPITGLDLHRDHKNIEISQSKTPIMIW